MLRGDIESDVLANQQRTTTSWDSPFIKFHADDSQSVDYTADLTMYLMFKPKYAIGPNLYSAEDNLPVPVRKIDWSFSGDAAKINNIWTIGTHSGDASPAAAPLSLSEFPIWNGRADEATWVKH